MKVRSFNDEDNISLGKIYDICRPQEFYAEKEKHKVVPWFEEAFIQDNICNSTIVVCEIGSEVVAFCGWRANHIHWLFVLPEFRKMGIAKKLLNEALSDMKGDITLLVWHSNERAKSLYKNIGFKIKDTKTVDYYGKYLKLDKMYIIKK